MVGRKECRWWRGLKRSKIWKRFGEEGGKECERVDMLTSKKGREEVADDKKRYLIDTTIVSVEEHRWGGRK